MKAYNLRAALQKPNEVTELYLFNQNLRSIPEVVFGFSKLKILALSKNRLSDIPSDIQRLSLLEELILTANEFEQIPKVIAKLNKLKVLNFDENYLDYFPYAVSQLSNLESFSAAKNRIYEVYETFFQPSLRKIDLGDNQISELPSAIQNCKFLTELNLKNNRIKKLPDAITECSRLRVIDLENNRLIQLPDNIGKLSNLEQLKLQENKISILPESIGDCSVLRKLNLHNNVLTTLPDSLGKLSWLTQLLLASNQISELPESIGGLSRLRGLSLKGNPLKTLPDAFFSLGSLKMLLFLNHKMDVPFSKFLELKSLKSIFSGDNFFGSYNKRQLVSFLNYARQDDISNHQRTNFYALLTEDKKLKKEDLIEALHFSMQAVRLKAQDQLYEFFNENKPISDQIILHFSGRRISEKKKYKEALASLGVKCVEKKQATNVSHIVLGEYPDKQLLINLEQVTFLFERDIVKYLKEQKKEAYTHFSEKELGNLSKLLLSAQPDSIALALEMLKTAIISDRLLTHLFIVYKIDSKGPHRGLMKRLLIQNGSHAVEKKLRLRLPLSKKIVGEESVQKAVEKYTEGTELLRARFYELLELEEKK